MIFTNSAPLGWVGLVLAMSIYLSKCSLHYLSISRPLIGPQITWSVQGLSLVRPLLFFFFVFFEIIFWNILQLKTHGLTESEFFFNLEPMKHVFFKSINKNNKIFWQTKFMRLEEPMWGLVMPLNKLKLFLAKKCLRSFSHSFNIFSKKNRWCYLTQYLWSFISHWDPMACW